MGENIKRKRKIKKDKGENHKMKIKDELKNAKGITLIALVITVLFSYDEKIKYSNSKGFLLTTI